MLLLSSARAQWGHGCSLNPKWLDLPLQAVTYSLGRKLDQLLSGIISVSARHTKAWLPFDFFKTTFFFFKEAHEHRTVQHVTEESCIVPLHKWQRVTQRQQYIHKLARAQPPPILVFLRINTSLLTGEKGEQAKTTQRNLYYPEGKDQKLPRTQMRLYSEGAPGTETTHQPAAKSIGSPTRKYFRNKKNPHKSHLRVEMLGNLVILFRLTFPHTGISALSHTHI